MEYEDKIDSFCNFMISYLKAILYIFLITLSLVILAFTPIGKFLAAVAVSTLAVTVLFAFGAVIIQVSEAFYNKKLFMTIEYLARPAIFWYNENISNKKLLEEIQSLSLN